MNHELIRLAITMGAISFLVFTVGACFAVYQKLAGKTIQGPMGNDVGTAGFRHSPRTKLATFYLWIGLVFAGMILPAYVLMNATPP